MSARVPTSGCCAFEVSLHGVKWLCTASRSSEDERALDPRQKRGGLVVRGRPRSSELQVDVGDGGLPAGDQPADVGAELVVVGGVDDGCSEWAALGVVVFHEQFAPGRHDDADRFRKGFGLGERLLGDL